MFMATGERFMGNDSKGSRGVNLEDTKKSMADLQKRIDSNDLPSSDTIYYMALNYFSGNATGEVDLEKGLELTEKAAELGNADAMCSLGDLYLEGDLVKKDVKKGLSLIQQAAQRNTGTGLCALGLLYFEGKFLPKDEQKHWICSKKPLSKTTSSQLSDSEIYISMEQKL